MEGRYDTARLRTVVDALIIETGGFGLFHDGEQLALLRRLAEQRGLLVLTDSDGAGFVIRNYIAGAIPPQLVKHAYIPEIAGKERRKTAASKEGLLGVEGMDGALILKALQRAGATFEEQDASEKRPFLTKADLYADGLSGGPDSAARRERLMVYLDLPRKLSVNRLLKVINATLSEEEYRRAVEVLREKQP